MTHAEFEKLCRLVEQWNENRLDLFHLSYPTKDLEIEGVMRFYFCDDAGRVCTKCIRVSSTATTQAVIEALVEKFLPDLRMLTDPEYSIWEVHEGGEERKLDAHEKPLLVQLNWHKDDREGRFLLKKHGMHFLPIQALQQHDSNANIKRSVKRFSKREKKEEKVKKKHKDIITVNPGRENLDVNDLYKQVPPTTFTRTISNPEIVMKKRREKKLESRLKDIGHGGSLKIYGGDVVPSRPYVTLLVSLRDRADDLLRETLVKYNLEDANPDQFELIEVSVPRVTDDLRRSLTDLTTVDPRGVKERIVSGDECPLMELAARPYGGDVFFALRRNSSSTRQQRTPPSIPPPGKPRAELVSMTGDKRRIGLADGVTEVGSDSSLRVYAIHHIQLPHLCGRHCVITFMDGVVTITPSSADAAIQVNKESISQTVMVKDADVILLGRDHIFTLALQSQTTFDAPNGTRQVERGETRIDSSSDGSISRHVTPLSIEIDDYRVWDFLLEAMSRSAECSPFPLSSAFSLFLALHSFTQERKPFVGQFLNRITTQLSQIAQEPSASSRSRLFYWLSNCAELHHLLTADFCLSSNPQLPQSNAMRDALQSLFTALVRTCTSELESVVGSFLNENIPDEDAAAPTLSILDSMLRAARSSLLNAALTIQLSSQLLAFLNYSLFNQLLTMSLNSKLGRLLHSRLTLVDGWAEKMGVELAAECLLDRCRQAATLLAAPKNDIAAMGATAYKLNSLQVRHLLSNLEMTPEEGPLGADVMQRVVGLAERQADETAIEEGEQLALYERSDVLRGEVVIPTECFVSDEGTKVNPSLNQYLEDLRNKGVCSSVTCNEGTSRGWIISSFDSYPSSPVSSPPRPSLPSLSSSRSLPPPSMGQNISSSSGQLVRIILHRGNGGIGLSIVAAQGLGDKQIGIYIKKVIDGSLAARDGRLDAGDELLSVNEKPLQGLTQEEAAQWMSSSGAEVRLVVKKGAAMRNGLSAYLGSPTPSNQMNPSSSPSFNRLPPSSSMDKNMYASIQKSESSIPVNGNNLSQSTHSAFTAPSKNYSRSISTSELYQHNDPNTSFSGRSIASTTSGFSALPSHYRRPTVIQPGRSCPSPSSLRHGAQSPSLLRTGAVSPSILRSGAISPSSLSVRPQSRGTSHTVPPSHTSSGLPPRPSQYTTVSSPPLARSSPVLPHSTIPSNSFHSSFNSRTTDLNQSIRSVTTDGARGLSSSIYPPSSTHYHSPSSLNRPSTTFDVVPSMAAAAASVAQSRESRLREKNMERSVRQIENESRILGGLMDDVSSDFSRVSQEEERRYRQLITQLDSPTRSVPFQRKETMIDDVVDGLPKENENDDDMDTPSIVGVHEVYRDPRSRKLTEMESSLISSPTDGSRLAFGDKMRLFATQIGETTPRHRMTESSAQRHIQHENTHVSP